LLVEVGAYGGKIEFREVSYGVALSQNSFEIRKPVVDEDLGRLGVACN
jgi:hypothetical protein